MNNSIVLRDILLNNVVLFRGYVFVLSLENIIIIIINYKLNFKYLHFIFTSVAPENK